MSAGLTVVAIDGPSGAGKSTIARLLADKLGWRHIDTGAMYRAVTWLFLVDGIDLDDQEAVVSGLASLDLVVDGDNQLWVRGDMPGDRLRIPEVEARVSKVSSLPAVRELLGRVQRELALQGPCVAEGRDMTSVVFPDAKWKIYLDARIEERARRRAKDFKARGRDVGAREVMVEIEMRDRLDSTRADAPLRRVADALVLDCSEMSIAEVLAFLAAHVEGDPPVTIQS